MYRNIVVAGDIGTGTTTLAKSLASKLNWKYLAAGDFFRSYAMENKIPLWNKELVPDEMEREVDENLFAKIKNENGWIIDSHYMGWFARDLNDVLRILLTTDPNVADDRIISRHHTHSETREEIEKRRVGLYAKFKKLYSTDDYEDPKFYQLVIDTTNVSASETLKQVLDYFNKSSK